MWCRKNVKTDSVSEPITIFHIEKKPLKTRFANLELTLEIEFILLISSTRIF